jgi:hypothetical protein
MTTPDRYTCPNIGDLTARHETIVLYKLWLKVKWVN